MQRAWVSQHGTDSDIPRDIYEDHDVIWMKASHTKGILSLNLFRAATFEDMTGAYMVRRLDKCLPKYISPHTGLQECFYIKLFYEQINFEDCLL